MKALLATLALALAAAAPASAMLSTSAAQTKIERYAPDVDVDGVEPAVAVGNTEEDGELLLPLPRFDASALGKQLPQLCGGGSLQISRALRDPDTDLIGPALDHPLDGDFVG